MRKIVKAKIRWMPEDEGGRKVITPVEIRYNPLIKFLGIKPRPHDDPIVSWSADIYNLEIFDDRTSIASLSYLVDQAPFEFLEIGNSFKLYEGSRLVAYGAIISEQI